MGYFYDFSGGKIWSGMELRNNEILRFEQSILIEKLINSKDKIEPLRREEAKIKNIRKNFGSNMIYT